MDEILNLISNDQIDEAFLSLKDKVNYYTDHHYTIIQLSGRYQRLKKAEIEGVIKPQDATIDLNQIRKSLIEICQQIENPPRQVELTPYSELIKEKSEVFEQRNKVSSDRLLFFINDLVNFASNPEAIYYIGTILIGLDEELENYSNTLKIEELIIELLNDLEEDERHSMGLFDPRLSIEKLSVLRRDILKLYLASQNYNSKRHLFNKMNPGVIAKELSGFNSNPEAIYYIGQLLVKADYILELVNYPNDSEKLINELIKEADDIEDILIDPKISVIKINRLRKLLKEISSPPNNLL